MGTFDPLPPSPGTNDRFERAPKQAQCQIAQTTDLVLSLPPLRDLPDQVRQDIGHIVDDAGARRYRSGWTRPQILAEIKESEAFKRLAPAHQQLLEGLYSQNDAERAQAGLSAPSFSNLAPELQQYLHNRTTPEAELSARLPEVPTARSDLAPNAAQAAALLQGQEQAQIDAGQTGQLSAPRFPRPHVPGCSPARNG